MDKIPTLEHYQARSLGGQRSKSKASQTSLWFTCQDVRGGDKHPPASSVLVGVRGPGSLSFPLGYPRKDLPEIREIFSLSKETWCRQLSLLVWTLQSKKGPQGLPRLGHIGGSKRL